MGDLVNLRQARKQKQRDEKARKADQNRALHGRTRGERSLTDQERKNADKQHDGHKRVDVADASDPAAEKSTGEETASAERVENNVVSIFAPEPDRSSDH
ncbi:DUF4169 family protein [Thalassospira sp. HF15]|uniref:DUF4169 family protein n=1 Tax=Thalassospira sp. HF15 TaxID=2722755 RepID=UPI00142FB0E8|nr:DUF4169 family protein [Thalassospira sp. HF15]NIY76392.1 DUF4169 family protein [Thalassospira sp. HF15]